MQKKSLSLIVLFLLSTLPLIGAEKDKETETYKRHMELLRERQLEEITENLKRLDTDNFLSATLNEKQTVEHFLDKKHYFTNGNHYAHRESSVEQLFTIKPFCYLKKNLQNSKKPVPHLQMK